MLDPKEREFKGKRRGGGLDASKSLFNQAWGNSHGGISNSDDFAARMNEQPSWAKYAEEKAKF